VKSAKVDNSRRAIMARLNAKIATGMPIIGGGAGCGLSAKSEEAGGIDLMIVYNSGRFRMAGRGSTAGLMPYGNANQIVKDMAPEILPVVKRTPVLAGVCATDPFLMLPAFLRELRELGFCGIQNFPTVGLIEGDLRQSLEETEMGFGKEVECVALAREMELLTTPYVFNTTEAVAMTSAGADLIVAHMGATTGGTIGATSSKTIEDCVRRVRAIVQCCKELRPEVLVLCHGGPISDPADAQFMLANVSGLDGFYGASSVERIPTETAIGNRIREFSALKLAAA
jgi:predicted TIM-barrel enzyme